MKKYKITSLIPVIMVFLYGNSSGVDASTSVDKGKTGSLSSLRTRSKVDSQQSSEATAQNNNESKEEFLEFSSLDQLLSGAMPIEFSKERFGSSKTEDLLMPEAAQTKRTHR